MQPSVTADQRLLQLDDDAFARAFASAPLQVSHGLAGHPLLTLDALADLAAFLPEDSIEHNRGQVPEIAASGEMARLDLPPGEIARGIETNGCWMVLKRIEQHADYRGLLNAVLDDVTPLAEGREGAVTRREGFVFLSSADSTTPVHIDPEHNFLLQIHGAKQMNVGRFESDMAEARELERYYAGGHRNLDRIPGPSSTFRLGPGDGVYVPLHAPHWVHTEHSFSISLSVTFYTEYAERSAVVHAVNARMRGLRLSPAPPGQRPAVDRAKAAGWSVARRLAAVGRRRRG